MHIEKRRALAERVNKYKVGEIREVEVMEDKWAMQACGIYRVAFLVALQTGTHWRCEQGGI